MNVSIKWDSLSFRPTLALLAIPRLNIELKIYLAAAGTWTHNLWIPELERCLNCTPNPPCRRCHRLCLSRYDTWIHQWSSNYDNTPINTQSVLSCGPINRRLRCGRFILTQPAYNIPMLLYKKQWEDTKKFVEKCMVQTLCCKNIKIFSVDILINVL